MNSDRLGVTRGWLFGISFGGREIIVFFLCLGLTFFVVMLCYRIFLLYTEEWYEVLETHF